MEPGVSKKDKLMNLKKPVFIIIAIGVILVMRLAFIGLMGLMPQDAYYYFYGQHLALSYFDHPPAIAYILKGFTVLFGKHVFVLHLADTMVTILTIWVFYKLSLLFLSKEKASKAVILLFSTAMITILSLVSTPDVPLLLFWTLTLWSLSKAIFFEKHSFWIWAGIFTGLAFDSKYTAVFLPAGLILFLLLSAKKRVYLFSKWMLVYIVCFLVTISPVIIWNWQHDFISFRFQSGSRIEQAGLSSFDPVKFAGVIGHQALILIPLLFFSILYFSGRTVKKLFKKLPQVTTEKLFLFCFFIPVFAGFLAISFFYWVKLNWMMPAYIAGIIWVCVYWNKKWISYQLALSVGIHLVLMVQILFYPVVIKSDDTWIGWENMYKQVKKLQLEYPGSFIFSADENKTTSILNFYSDEMVYSLNIIGKKALQYDYIGTETRSLAGKDALFIDSDPDFMENDDNPPDTSLKHYFEEIIPLNPIIVEKGGKPVRVFSVYLCRNYKPE